MTGPADNGNCAKLLNRRAINNDRVVIKSEKVYCPTSAFTDQGLFVDCLGKLFLLFCSQTLAASLSRSLMSWLRKVYCRTILAENILLSENTGNVREGETEDYKPLQVV